MTENQKSINRIIDEYSDKLRKFEKWIASKPNFPQNLNKLLLIRYIKVCGDDVEKAEKLLEINLKFREKHPHIFTNRDVNSEELKKIQATIQVCPLPNLTKEKNHITIFRLIDKNPNNYNVNDTVKWIFLIQDLLFATSNDNEIADGEICIFDSKDFSIWHFFKLVSGISTVKAFMTYVQEAVPHRLVQNHYVNCSPVLMKIMTLIRPFLNKELNDTMHFHTTGLDTLYNFVPKESLPPPYGSFGNLEELYEETLRDVQNLGGYLGNDENWKLTK